MPGVSSKDDSESGPASCRRGRAGSLSEIPLGQSSFGPFAIKVLGHLDRQSAGLFLPRLGAPDSGASRRPPWGQPVTNHGFLGQSQHLLHLDGRVVDRQCTRHPGEVGAWFPAWRLFGVDGGFGPGAMSLPLPKSAGSASLASPSLGRLLADLLLVALGAIPGSLLRWLVDDLSVVNLLGAFVLGWLSATAAGRPRAWLLVGGVGFCGSLTSFSGWILALYYRIQASGWWVALACWLLELLSGLLFAALGLGLGQWMQRRWSAQLGDHLKH